MNKVIENLMGDNATELFDIDSVKGVLFGLQNYFVAPSEKGSSEAITAFNREADKVFAGEQTVAQAIDAMKEAAKKIVAENK
jgi:ABC-type glycerol-3-phosphate transport system substrate-binding protein